MKRGYVTFETSKRTAANFCTTSGKHMLTQIGIQWHSRKVAIGDTVTIQPSLLYIAMTAASNKPSPNSSSEKALLSTRGVIEIPSAYARSFYHPLYMPSGGLGEDWGSAGVSHLQLLLFSHDIMEKIYHYVPVHKALLHYSFL